MSQKAMVHIFVSGRVQGVFYRESAKRKAEELGLLGWVRNLPDSRVEAVFEGGKLGLYHLQMNLLRVLPLVSSCFAMSNDWYKTDRNNTAPTGAKLKITLITAN